MGFTIAQRLVLVLLIASTMALSIANKGWQHGNWPSHGPYPPNNTQTSNRITWVTPTTGIMALTTPIGQSNMALST